MFANIKKRWSYQLVDNAGESLNSLLRSLIANTQNGILVV